MNRQIQATLKELNRRYGETLLQDQLFLDLLRMIIQHAETENERKEGKTE